MRKPLRWMLSGGILALSALALIGWVAWRTWHESSLKADDGVAYIALLSPAYLAGLFLFSYGYTGFHLWKAFLLTLLLAVLSVVGFVLLTLVKASPRGRSRRAMLGRCRTCVGPPGLINNGLFCPECGARL